MDVDERMRLYWMIGLLLQPGLEAMMSRMCVSSYIVCSIYYVHCDVDGRGSAGDASEMN